MNPMDHYNNLDDVREHLGLLFANKDTQRLAIRDFLMSLNTTNIYRTLLESVLENKSLLEQIARSSYSHVNGFDKITLLNSTKPEYTLRLHIWWPGQVPNIGNIHNHPSDFSSTILTGSLSFQHYEENEAGEIAVQQFDCLTHREKSYYEVRPVGWSHLCSVFEGQMTAGTTYSISAEVLHRIVNISGKIAATLMMYGSVPSKSASKIFSESPLDMEEQSKMEYFNETTLEEKLKCLLDMTSQSY
jgi:hypothetical protein